MSYHHGGLRRALLDATAAQAADAGVDSLSLRALARSLGVSHTALRHHFSDRRGLLTALAAEGYALLADAVELELPDALEAGVTYAVWMVEHPGHFAVMFHPDLVCPDDPDLTAAMQRMRRALGVVGRESSHHSGEVLSPRSRAAWSIAHGFATLAVSGNFGALPDLREAARDTLRHLGPGLRAG